MRKKLWFKALMMTMVVVLGGALASAWASVPDKNGNVRTCYSKKSGSLRVLKSSKSKCSKKKERSLTLNAKGRTGARGPRGAVGPSAAYAVHPDGTQQNVTGTPKVVASLALPAGSFAVFAQVRVATLTTATNADCSLRSGGQFLTSGNVNLAAVSGDRKVIPLNDVLVLAAPGTLDLQCVVTGPPMTRFGADEIRISAIKVGAAQVQGP